MSPIQALLNCFDECVDNMPVPAADALEAILQLLKEGRGEDFIRLMKGDESSNREMLENLIRSYEAKPIEFEGWVNETCAEYRSEYLNTARRKLDSLTAFVHVAVVERSQAEKMILLADTKNQLLHLSVAHSFVSRLPNGLNRANQLSEWSITVPSSEQADLYLMEACNCFLFGLDTACVVMCRSLLEEVLERKLPTSLLLENARLKGKGWTLGSLLDVINNNLNASGISAQIPARLRSVNSAGSRAAHFEPVTPQAALSCLKETRSLILELL